MNRIYEKYLNAEGEDRFDYIDSLANRYGYMVIASLADCNEVVRMYLL